MPLPIDERPVEWVTDKNIIQREFNKRQYHERAEAGELTLTVADYDRHRAPNTEPTCTRSQIIRYYDQDNEVLAVAHRYLRPDGTIGASVRPDPKCLYLEDRIMKFRPKKRENEEVEN